MGRRLGKCLDSESRATIGEVSRLGELSDDGCLGERLGKCLDSESRATLGRRLGKCLDSESRATMGKLQPTIYGAFGEYGFDVVQNAVPTTELAYVVDSHLYKLLVGNS